MMNIKLKNLFCFAALSSVSATAFAGPQITFDGEVSDQTCSLSLNGGGASYVLMNPVRVTDFGSSVTVGKTVGNTDITLSATGCNALAAGQTSKDLKVKLLGHNVDPASGILKNSYTGTSAASGVGFQLFDGATAVPLTAAPYSVTIGSLSTATTNADVFSKTLSVKYYATSTTITEGKVQGVLEYAISYF